ncbi:MAG: archaeoflavoprotein AfpA [Thermoproteota archaeon]
MTLKVAWGITGCGDRLSESVETMKKLREEYSLEVDVILSSAGEMVVTWYNFWDSIKQEFDEVFIESTPNTPFLVAPLQMGRYDLLLVCPATANTTAKVAYGIADSLLTNCVAQAMKADLPVFIFPTDQEIGKTQTVLPNKDKITLNIREIDVQNVEKLKRVSGIEVLSDPKDVEPIVSKFSQSKGQI